MASFVVMPKCDQEMAFGEILAWKKTEGERVAEGETIFDFKTGTTIAAVAAASNSVVLAIMVHPGAKVPVDMPVAILGEYGEPIGVMMAEARKRLGKLMIFDAITGATEKMKAQIPLDELPCTPPDHHPAVLDNAAKKK